MTGGKSPRARGDYFERQTREDLEKRGWVIARCAGSLGPFDLVAMQKHKRPLLVSCKTNGKTTPAERRRLLLAAINAGALPIVAFRSERGRVGYVRLVMPPAETTETAANDDAESEIA